MYKVALLSLAVVVVLWYFCRHCSLAFIWAFVASNTGMWCVPCGDRLPMQHLTWHSLAVATQVAWKTWKNHMMTCQLRM